jgi:hypothetical protein
MLHQLSIELQRTVNMSTRALAHLMTAIVHRTLALAHFIELLRLFEDDIRTQLAHLMAPLAQR